MFVAADDLAVTVAREAVDQPGADRIHARDLADVDQKAIALDLLELVGERPHAGKRQLARKEHSIPVAVDALSEIGSFARLDCHWANNPVPARTFLKLPKRSDGQEGCLVLAGATG